MAADKVWDGGAGNDLWFSGNNWNPNGIPLTNQSVRHDLAGTTITYKQQAGDQNPLILSYEGQQTAPNSATLVIGTESELTVKDEMSFSALATGSYTINLAGGTGTTDDGGILRLDDGVDTNAITQRFNWIVNSNSSGGVGADDAQVIVVGTIGAGTWTVKGFVDAITINSTSPWTLQDGGFVVADDFLDLTGWSIGNGEMVTETVQVDNFMRMISGTINPTGMIDAANDITNDNKPRIDIEGLVEILGGNGTDGLIVADRLNVLNGGELRLRDGNFDLQLEVKERYARIASGGKLSYGSGSNAAAITSNAQAAGVNLIFNGVHSLLTRVSGTSGTLFLEVACSTDILTEVTSTAGRAWNATGVDLKISPDGFEGAGPDLEVTTPDDCNIMFVDSSGNLFPANPCIKFWRSLEVNRTNMELVDNRDNYVNSIATDEAAIYLINNINHHGGTERIFDLNGNALYYGGSNDSDSTFTDGRVKQLIKTTYGDFDGDCDIDAADQTQFDGVYSGSGVVTCFPLADADGDCDVDAADEAIFDANYGLTSRCYCPGVGYCNTPATTLDTSCPDVPSCLTP